MSYACQNQEISLSWIILQQTRQGNAAHSFPCQSMTNHTISPPTKEVAWASSFSWQAPLMLVQFALGSQLSWGAPKPHKINVARNQQEKIGQKEDFDVSHWEMEQAMTRKVSWNFAMDVAAGKTIRIPSFCRPLMACLGCCVNPL